MKVNKTTFNGVYEIIPKIHHDNRGYFFEAFKESIINSQINNNIRFIQDNQSFSKNKFTFRGIHLQKKPFCQSKIIRVIKGAIIDFVFDMDPKSPTFLKNLQFKIDSINNKQIFLDGNYGHAFLTLTDNTIVSYKTSEIYSKSHEVKISPYDKKLKLNLDNYLEDHAKLIISEDDINGLTISKFLEMFNT